MSAQSIASVSFFYFISSGFVSPVSSKSVNFLGRNPVRFGLEFSDGQQVRRDHPRFQIKLEPHPISVDEDLNDAAKEVQDEMKAKTTEGLLDPELFQQFAIDREADFENALQNGAGKIGSSGVVSIKSEKSKLKKHSKPETGNSDKKRHKNNSGSKSHKKKA